MILSVSEQGDKIYVDYMTPAGRQVTYKFSEMPTDEALAALAEEYDFDHYYDEEPCVCQYNEQERLILSMHLIPYVRDNAITELTRADLEKYFPEEISMICISVMLKMYNGLSGADLLDEIDGRLDSKLSIVALWINTTDKRLVNKVLFDNNGGI